MSQPIAVQEAIRSGYNCRKGARQGYRDEYLNSRDGHVISSHVNGKISERIVEKVDKPSSTVGIQLGRQVGPRPSSAKSLSSVKKLSLVISVFKKCRDRRFQDYKLSYSNDQGLVFFFSFSFSPFCYS